MKNLILRPLAVLSWNVTALALSEISGFKDSSD